MSLEQSEVSVILKATADFQPRVELAPEDSPMRRWFDAQWDELESQESYEGEVEFPPEWGTGIILESQWIEEKPEQRRGQAIKTARAYRTLLRRDQDPTYGKRDDEKKEIADAQKHIDRVRNARGENFSQHVVLGFEYEIESNLEDAAKTVGDAITDTAELGDDTWNSELLGEMPAINDQRLKNELTTLLGLMNASEVLSDTDPRKILKIVEGNILRIEGDSRINSADKTKFREAAYKIHKAMKDKIGFTLNEAQPTSEWNEEVYGPRPLDDEGNPLMSPEGELLYKKLALLVQNNMEQSQKTGRQDELLRRMQRLQDEFFSKATEDGSRIGAHDLAQFQDYFNRFFTEIASSLEGFERKSIMEAFMDFAVTKGLFGGAREEDPNYKALQARARALLKAENPTNDEHKDDFVNFKQWFRGWMISELDDVTETNKNTFISGISQISASLVVRGLQQDLAIIQILGQMDGSKPDWKKFVGESIHQLQVMSAINNRERLYARAKNISPDEVAKTMIGIAEQAAGRGESLGLTGDSWRAVLQMEEINGASEGFGETFRKAMALYLARDRNYLGGALTKERLEAVGIVVPDDVGVNEVTDNAGNIVHVVSGNIFPLENRSADFVKTQRTAMVRILQANSGSLAAANWAEKLAFKAMEAGFVGADLDVEMSSKEAVFKLLHSRIYRKKYARGSKGMGNPLNVDDIDRLMMNYFDLVFLPLDDNSKHIPGVTRSFRQYIIDTTIPAKEIPIHRATERLDYMFYDSGLKWSAKMWEHLMKGTGVQWEEVMKKGKGEQIQPEYIDVLQDVYKNVGYWVGGLSIDQLGAFVEPWDDNSLVGQWCERTRLDPNHPDYLSEAKFKTWMARKVFRRMVYRELEVYGSRYNEAARISLGHKYGARLDAHDIKNIAELLIVGTTKLELVHDLLEPDDELLFDEDIVLDMFNAAGITSGQATFLNIVDILAEMAERAAFMKRAGHH